MIESVLEKWESSSVPESKEQLVRNLLFLDIYGLENDMPIQHGDFFNPLLEWELLLDFPDIADEPSESLLFLGHVSQKDLADIQYATILGIIIDYPELIKYLNAERLTGEKNAEL